MNLKKMWLFAGMFAVAVSLARISFGAVGTGEVTGTVKVSGVRDSANVVVYLAGAGKNTVAPPKHGVMDQQNLTFEPHVLPVVKGAAVDFPNSDKVRHNVYSPAGSAKRFNLGTYPAGTVKTLQFEEPGVVPLLCNVHSEMSAFVVVLDTPYYATTDKFGRFSIKGVAPGKYVLRAWHEKVKSVEQEVIVNAGGPTKVELAMTERK